MLTTNRSLVENSTGKSVGLAPFRILSIAPSQGTGPSWGGGRHFSADNPALTICPVRTRTPPPIRQQRASSVGGTSMPSAFAGFGSAFGVRGNRVQLANNVLSRNVTLGQRADLGVEIDHLFTECPSENILNPLNRL